MHLTIEWPDDRIEPDVRYLVASGTWVVKTWDVFVPLAERFRVPAPMIQGTGPDITAAASAFAQAYRKALDAYRLAKYGPDAA